MKQPESWVALTLTQLTDRLTSDLDVVEFLTTVAERGARQAGASEVADLLADQGGMLTSVASSSGRVRIIELLERQNHDGPGLACYRGGEPLHNVVLDEGAFARWPAFAPRAAKAGFATVHSLPLRQADLVIGVLTFLHETSHEIDLGELAFAQSLGDLVAAAIDHPGSAPRHADLTTRLRAVLDERVVIDQARGIVAQRLAADPDTAFALMRSYVHTAATRLDDLAAELVSGRLAPEELTRRRRSAPVSARARMGTQGRVRAV